MTRTLAVLLLAGLVVAPAAGAKGPHAVLTSGPEAVEAGKPWVATVELNEFLGRPHPGVVATRGDRRVTGRVRRAGPGMYGALRFRIRMVLPSEGRWRLAIVAGRRHFAFPALDVGGGQAPQDYVAFPRGSEAARQGAGGVWSDGPEADLSGRGTPLPPETVSLAAAPDDGGGLPLWIPALGIALAGAGLGLGLAHRR